VWRWRSDHASGGDSRFLFVKPKRKWEREREMEVGRSEGGGKKNEKDERRERVSEMRVFFYFINIKGLVGRAGGYPPDKICEIRYPSENPKNKKILIHIHPNMACGRAIGSGGFVGRVGFNGFFHPYQM
jgi:hypothetical protein